jgi:hypothetical protein
MDTWLQIGMKGGLIVFIDLKLFLFHIIYMGHMYDQRLALHCVWLHVNAARVPLEHHLLQQHHEAIFPATWPNPPPPTTKKKKCRRS